MGEKKLSILILNTLKNYTWEPSILRMLWRCNIKEEEDIHLFIHAYL